MGALADVALSPFRNLRRLRSLTHIDSEGGEAEDSMIAMEGLGRWTLLALLIIYALLAIPLHSYSQPLVIMSVIPFGAMMEQK